MTTRYWRSVRFDRPKPLTDFMENGLSVPGHEMGGLALSPMALAAYAESKASGKPCEIAVMGEEWLPDGRHYLTFGVPLDYIEAVSDFRQIDGRLVYVCPECREYHDHHRKSCSLR